MFDKKTRKKFTILCWNVWGSTLNCKFLTGFFVGWQTFAIDCSSLEIFFEILKTSRHKELAFLWRDVFRFFNSFLSGQRAVVKVQAPPLTFYFAQRYSMDFLFFHNIHTYQSTNKMSNLKGVGWCIKPHTDAPWLQDCVE